MLIKDIKDKMELLLPLIKFCFVNTALCLLLTLVGMQGSEPNCIKSKVEKAFLRLAIVHTFHI